MATISTSEITGLKLIGNPLVLKITPATTPDGATFHRAILEVTVSSSDNRTGTFRFSQPVTGSGTLPFDIASALQAMADQYEYSADVYTNYPAYSFTARAWDEWLKDGEVNDNASSAATASASGFYPGAFTDRERLFASERPSRWSRKPCSQASPEIVFATRPVLFPTPFGNNPGANKYNIDDRTGQYDDTYKAYVIARPADGYELRFVNGLGVHETIHVTCLRTAEVGIHTDRYTIARSETLTKFSRGVAIKQNNHERWHLSSPPLDRQWQEWYLHEVLMARWMWINVPNGATDCWLPVHILPDETVKSIDRQKANALTVEFTVEFDITGSPTK